MRVGRAGWSLATHLLLPASLLVAACGGSSEPDAATPATTSTTVVAEPSTVAPPTVTPPTEPPTTAGPEPNCIVTVAAGDYLGRIAASVDGVTVEELRDENRLTDDHVIHPGDELDVCIGNDVDDVTGASRLAPEPAAVRRQQTKLNELFARYRIADLAVDGDSGPLTRQLLCAARMGLGLPVSAAHMAPGSTEEDALFEATSVSIPAGAPVWADRWVLIDQTCQVMFTGEHDDRIVDIFPTSTGEPGFETRSSQGVAAFRYDPAVETGGWHDSSRFPVEIDNPLNGNMYKPIYFNNGQAIHGANNVPPEPRSKGCARLAPWHQDVLIDWLGLADVDEPTWRTAQIGVTVAVQGEYRPGA